MAAKRERADRLVVDRNLADSRERARRLILSGAVWSGERRVDKAGDLLAADAPLEVRGSETPFVSRGGLKLEAALNHWRIDVHGAIAVDVGASTGGFTDCLLQRGAARVFAIDVGYGQFAWSLRQDARVKLFERANVRYFEPSTLGTAADIVVGDLSFISLELVLPVMAAMLRPGGTLLPLVKPQFEVGKGRVGKGGVVRDPALRQEAVDAVGARGKEIGLLCNGSFLSPTPGPKGNREFFIYFVKPGA
jgi:23S rRNA (cytidine1920-2'-O)/16S rRNA (cytidine1409-2'-O)-methyltransferase